MKTYTPPRIDSLFTSTEAPLTGTFIAKIEGRLWVIPALPDGWHKRRPLLGKHSLTSVGWNTLVQKVLELRGVPEKSRA